MHRTASVFPRSSLPRSQTLFGNAVRETLFRACFTSVGRPRRNTVSRSGFPNRVWEPERNQKEAHSGNQKRRSQLFSSDSRTSRLEYPKLITEGHSTSDRVTVQGVRVPRLSRRFRVR